MASADERDVDEIFRLLSEQRDLLTHWPYTNEHIRKEKEIAGRIRKLIDQNTPQTTALERTEGG